MRILIYGFGPYGRYQDNITARIIKSLPRLAGLKKVIFSVRFDRRQFIDAIERHRPDVILGLGQSSGRAIEVETCARNRRRTRRKARLRPIRFRGPPVLPTTLGPGLSPWLRRSRNPGAYVCNFSMYVLLDHLRRKRAGIRYGFVHVPHSLALRVAARAVRRLLRQIAR